MAYVYAGEGSLDYYPCRYGKSKLLFRGPRRDLEGAYVTVLGGTETYGKFVPAPYPVLVEQETGIKMVNLGAVNAGFDVFLNEPAVLDIAAKARAVVIQLVGAQNLSNRFYSVHPRRNDRFLRASSQLQSLFRDVDFTEFHFTRNMLHGLQRVSPERFEVVAEELRATWVARLTALLDTLPTRTILLWFASHPPPQPGTRADLALDPLLIDSAMISAVRSRAADYIEAISSPRARVRGLEGMAFAPMEEPAAMGIPGPAVHQEVATCLSAALARLL